MEAAHISDDAGPPSQSACGCAGPDLTCELGTRGARAGRWCADRREFSRHNTDGKLSMTIARGANKKVLRFFFTFRSADCVGSGSQRGFGS